MKSQDLRNSFLKFFEKKGHAVVPSSSLLPDDPSVLLTTAGMQQFKPYYSRVADPLASPHPSLGGKSLGSKNAASIQKSFRTSDIDEVGDETHLTFFEMMGNFSFGGYFKKDAIRFAYDYFSEIKMPIDYVTIFKGDGEAPLDQDSEKIWKDLSAKDIRRYGREDNFWGPTGEEGPCGPCSEVYVDDVEIWNIVFNEYYKEKGGKYRKLDMPGVDTGMGLERLAVASQKVNNIFETDLFAPIIEKIGSGFDKRNERIIADHSRSIVFLLSDGVRPSNKEAGYILRRLIRRVLVSYYLKSSGDGADENVIRGGASAFFKNIFNAIEGGYKEFYPEINSSVVEKEFGLEADKFMSALRRGINKLNKMGDIAAKDAFYLYESFGLPYEVIVDVAPDKIKNVSRDDFEKKVEEHREKSRSGLSSKFGGHGLVLDTGEIKARNQEEVEKATRLHTATHLTQAALRLVLGGSVKQAGSDITAQRLRFDFTFDRKLTDEEIKAVEEKVNGYIKEGLDVERVDMPYKEAINSGALYFEKEKYPAEVKVYSIGKKGQGSVSKELCGGPHVKNSKELGIFRVIKQESVASGVRRIRAALN